MGDLINLDEYRERKQEEEQAHEWTDEQLALLLFDIMYLDMLDQAGEAPDITDAVMERIRNEASEED